MADPFEHDDVEWVEICDANGKRSSMRLLAAIGFSGKIILSLAPSEKTMMGKKSMVFFFFGKIRP